MKTRFSLIAAAAVIAGLGVTALVVAQTTAQPDLKFGALLGKNELTADGHTGAGDPDGKGTASGTLVKPDTLCYGLTVKGIEPPTAAHIHRGNARVNGPVVITLIPPPTGDPGVSSACVSGISPELMADLREHASRFYWNVHTTDFPGGAIRGQLFNAPR